MTGSANQREKLIDLLWLLLFGAASAWWCVTAARALSATFDEPTYLRLGLEHWRTWAAKPLMKLGAMPLAIDLQTLPLFLWEKWHGLTIDPAREIAWILPWARTATLIFWWTLLIYTWRAGRALAGAWGGRLAVAILACEPVFLAHAGLATSDIAVTACLLAFLFEFRAHRNRRWPMRILLPAALYGIALLTKASALVFGVIGMFAIEFERVLASGAPRDWRALRSFLRDACGIVGGGLALMFVYCGSDFATEPTFIKWAQTLAPGILHDAMLWSSEHLRIFSNAGEGLVQQIKHNIRGHGAFLLGREYLRSVWFYFPVALTIKTSPLLLFLPLVIAAIRRRALWNWACLAALFLLLFSLNSRVQIGVRFMLPLLGCLAVGLAAAVVQSHRLLGPLGKKIVVGVVGLGLVGNAIAAARVWPQALAYTNMLWGGTGRGYRLLSDSNYDWGQGLLELDHWRQQHQVDTIDVWYFGADPRVGWPPFRPLPLHSSEWLADRPPALVVRGKCVAVSLTLLYGAYAKRTAPGEAAVAFFLAHQPIDRTTTFFIYDFRGEK